MSEATCRGCAARGREIQRLRVRARLDFEEVEELQSDNRALRRAINRLWKQREDSREDDHDQDPAP